MKVPEGTNLTPEGMAELNAAINGTERQGDKWYADSVARRRSNAEILGDQLAEASPHPSITLKNAHGTFTASPEAVCQYSARHKLNGVPAVTVIDCGPVGKVPACQKCADFYERMSLPLAGYAAPVACPPGGQVSRKETMMAGSGIRVAVTVVIEMTEEQRQDYAAAYGLPKHGGPLMQRHVVEDVREYVLTAIQDSPAFGEIGRGDGTRAATVTLK